MLGTAKVVKSPTDRVEYKEWVIARREMWSFCKDDVVEYEGPLRDAKGTYYRIHPKLNDFYIVCPDWVFKECFSVIRGDKGNEF